MNYSIFSSTNYSLCVCVENGILATNGMYLFIIYIGIYYELCQLLDYISITPIP